MDADCARRGRRLFVSARAAAPVRVETSGWDDAGRADGRRRVSRPHHAIRRARRSRRGRRGRGARRAEVRHPHRPRRRHPSAGSSRIYRRRAAARRASRSAPTTGTTSRSTCRGRRIRSAAPAGAVVEDVHRLGGFGIAAHPDSPKADAALDRRVGADRRHRVAQHRQRVARRDRGSALRAPASPTSSVPARRPGGAARSSGDTRSLGRLLAAAAGGGDRRRRRARRRRAPREDPGRSLFGTDRHSELRGELPRVEQSRAVLDRPLTGDAAPDARAVFGAIREGTRLHGDRRARRAGAARLSRGAVGSERDPDGEGDAADRRASCVLIGPDGEVRARRPRTDAAKYRADRPARTGWKSRLASAPGHPPVPWLVSNPVYVGELRRPPFRRSRRRRSRVIAPVPLADRKGSGVERDPADAGDCGANSSITLADGPARQPVRGARQRPARAGVLARSTSRWRPTDRSAWSVQVRHCGRPAVGEVVLRGSCRDSVHAVLSELPSRSAFRERRFRPAESLTSVASGGRSRPTPSRAIPGVSSCRSSALVK